MSPTAVPWLVLPPLSPLCRHSAPQQGWILGYSALQPGEIVQAVDKLARLSYRA